MKKEINREKFSQNGQDGVLKPATAAKFRNRYMAKDAYRPLLAIFVIAILSFGLLLAFKRENEINDDLPANEKFFSKKIIVEINNRKFRAEIADTPEKRAKGLGTRESLCEDCAMLFLFSEKKEHLFWMKDMNFPLDIVWIDDAKIISTAKNVPPEYFEALKPNAPADKVLEINGGLCEKYDIKEGDTVIFKKPIP